MSQLGSDVGIAMTRNSKAVRRRGLEPPRSLPPLEPESISNGLFSRETRIVKSQKTPQKTSRDCPFRDRRSLVGIDQSTDTSRYNDCASPSSGPAPQATETLGRRHPVACLLVLMICLVASLGCQRQTQGKQTTIANGYEVSRLFTVEGVTVYRFGYYGKDIFFATRGSVSWTELRNTGKSTVSIPRETQTVELDGGVQ